MCLTVTQIYIVPNLTLHILCPEGKPTMRMVWLGLLALLVIVDGVELRADAEQPLKSSSGSLPLSQAAGEAGAEYLLHPLKVSIKPQLRP